MMLTDKQQTTLVVPMEPQPEGALSECPYDSNPCWYDDAGNHYQPPHRVGELIPVREEWRVKFWGRDRESDYVDLIIEFRDGGTKEKSYCPDGEDPAYWGKFCSDWQPASTMPDRPVRYRRPVTGVEYDIVQDPCGGCGGAGWDVEPGFPVDSYGNPSPVEVECRYCGGSGEGDWEHVWLFTLGELTTEGPNHAV